MRPSLISVPLLLLSIFFIRGALSAQPVSKVPAYSAFLITLDKKNPNSIITARTELDKQFSTTPDSEAVKAFREFSSFYSSVVNTCSRSYFWSNSKDTYRKDYQTVLNMIISGEPRLHYIPPDEDPLQILEKHDPAVRDTLEKKYGAALKDLREFRKCGMWFIYGEGDWYVSKDPEFLLSAGSFLKGDYKDYLVFLAQEEKKPIAEDAGLLISWDELRQKIIRYETFANNHPDLPETDSEVRSNLGRFFRFYLTGIDNTRAYDLNFFNKGASHGTGAINPELRKSYKTFLEKTKTPLFTRLSPKYEIYLKRIISGSTKK